MKLPKRSPLRLTEYDYGQAGYYFITFCTKDRAGLLCRGEHRSPAAPLFPLSPLGAFINQAIESIPIHYPTVRVDKYVVMPNHVHLILVLAGDGGRTVCAPTVSRVIKQLKESVSKQAGTSIWQKSFYDHVIRDETDYLNIWNYVDTNPAKWREDRYFTPPL